MRDRHSFVRAPLPCSARLRPAEVCRTSPAPVVVPPVDVVYPAETGRRSDPNPRGDGRPLGPGSATGTEGTAMATRYDDERRPLRRAAARLAALAGGVLGLLALTVPSALAHITITPSTAE